MIESIKAIIIDDERKAREMLGKLLLNFEEVDIVAKASGVDEAIPLILDHKPELLFLDVQMPEKDGFELLHEIKEFDVQPTVIFVTAYDEYAIEAIRHSAFDYLTKPVDPKLLKISIERYKSEKKEISNKENIQLILKQLSPDKIRFNTRSGIIFLSPKDIIYIQAEGNYSEIFLKDGTTKMVSINLSKVNQKLSSGFFAQISRSAYINTRYLDQLDRKKRLVTISNDETKFQLKVSRTYMKKFDLL